MSHDPSHVGRHGVKTAHPPDHSDEVLADSHRQYGVVDRTLTAPHDGSAEAATSELPLAVEAHRDDNDDETAPTQTPAAPSKRGARARAWWTATTGIWIGVGLVAVGFVAIFYTWSKVAGLLNVAHQMPYLVSGGIAGLAVVIVGAVAIDVAVRRQDSREREQQLEQIALVLDEFRAALNQQDIPEHQENGP